MKPHTVVCMKLESVGRPVHTVTHTDISVRDATLEIAKWLLDSYMGTAIRITLARTTAELDKAVSRNVGGGTNSTELLMDELASVLDQGKLELDENPEPSLLGDDE